MGVQVIVNCVIIYNLDLGLPQQYLAGLALLISLIMIYVFGKRYFYKRLSHGL
jgi:hypothetical protein